MHPFGGTPICPRCNKAVYAAEQVMGPGRKPCLACTSCNKRLDSLTLLEHDQEPYCKNCHIRNFGTRDLRQANLPDRDDLTSPIRSTFPLPTTRTRTNGSLDFTSRTLVNDGSRSPVRTQHTGPGPLLRANSSLPARYTRTPNPPSDVSTPGVELNMEGNDTAEEDEVQDIVDERVSFDGEITNTKRVGEFQLPRTVSLSPSRPTSRAAQRVDSTPFNRPTSPFKPSLTGVVSSGGVGSLKQTATGTRYGAALGGSTASPAKTWELGGTTPVCPRCGKNVYFAEQMKAVGKTWHKGCLRCTSCNTLLDSKRLNDKDGDPLCGRCYNKLHGPQGNGYALLGKPGS
ncbi:hypothetical protein L210DRAFT_3404327 [Boletus edulis BED1]|uniref:Cysteine-rich protein 1 n=1 Tax=Boletus edulis BED1 TaxID=1328754 RepID=A0AAD4BT38_BOLED|nr:hypothetical protein L210DRAFT_3404327 [Boletus edulis BED1]